MSDWNILVEAIYNLEQREKDARDAMELVKQQLDRVKKEQLEMTRQYMNSVSGGNKLYKSKVVGGRVLQIQPNLMCESLYVRDLGPVEGE